MNSPPISKLSDLSKTFLLLAQDFNTRLVNMCVHLLTDLLYSGEWLYLPQHSNKPSHHIGELKMAIAKSTIAVLPNQHHQHKFLSAHLPGGQSIAGTGFVNSRHSNSRKPSAHPTKSFRPVAQPATKDAAPCRYCFTCMKSRICTVLANRLKSHFLC